MKTLRAGAPEPRSDRYATHLLHDEPNVRVVGFHLLPGQSVPPHRSDSTVIVQVVEGRGVFRGEDGEAALEAGMAAVYLPGETHSMEAIDDPVRFQAIISPGPAR